MPETKQRLSKRERGVEQQMKFRSVRRAKFLAMYDFTTGRGLEVGPLDAGIADREVDDVRYVDVFDTEGLRAHYAEDLSVLPEMIPEVDYPLYLEGRYRDLAEAAAPGGPFDWVIASHVIEHVPDFIGWLRQVAEVTADGAALLLAVPDRRYTFDRHRPPTTVGQALEAHERGETRPGTRAIHDFTTAVVNVRAPELQDGAEPPGLEARLYDLEEAKRRVERSRSGEYVDCHVWVWTPTDFQQQIAELRKMGLLPWFVESVTPDPLWGEFLVLLRKGVDGKAPDGVVEPDPGTTLPGWLYDELHVLHARIKQLEERNETLRARTKRQKERIALLRERLDEARQRATAHRGVRTDGRALAVSLWRRLNRGDRAR